MVQLVRKFYSVLGTGMSGRSTVLTRARGARAYTQNLLYKSSKLYFDNNRFAMNAPKTIGGSLSVAGEVGQ